MTTSLKKLLLISITVLLGVMSGGVMAQQTVTHIAGNEYSFNGVNYDISYVNTSYSADSTLLNSQPWWGNADLAQTLSIAVGSSLTATGGNSSTSGPYFAYLDNLVLHKNTYSYWITGTSTFRDATSDAGSYNYAIATVNTAGAPEIDGSLAPKVGFLLGCLFLMFGRKKQNAEPMLTA